MSAHIVRLDHLHPIVRPVRLHPDNETNLAARIRAGDISYQDVEDLYVRSSGFADWFDKCGRQIWQRGVIASKTE